MLNQSHGSEEHIDYVVVHRALGQPRYAFRFHFIQLTTFEALLTGITTVIVYLIIDKLNLGSRSIFGFFSWDWMPFVFLIFLPLLFSIIHQARPDLKITETLTGAFEPTQFKDLQDSTWKPSPRRSAATQQFSNNNSRELKTK